MLEDKLEIHMAIHKCNMFTQDDAPCHHSKIVNDFFMKKNIKMLNRLDSSPDLNLIENLQAILKDKVADEHPTSAKDLVRNNAYGHKRLQLNTASTWCIACLVICKLLSRTKVDIPNTRFYIKLS